MRDADIVISSTAATALRHHQGQGRRRPQGPQAAARCSSSTSPLPRDIDPAVNDLADVYLYDIDDLNGVVESNLEERMREAERAEVIIDEEMAAFERVARVDGGRADGRRDPRARPRRSARPSSRRRSSASAGSPRRNSQTVDALTASIVNKMLHGPTAAPQEGRRREGRLRRTSRRRATCTDSTATPRARARTG